MIRLAWVILWSFLLTSLLPPDSLGKQKGRNPKKSIHKKSNQKEKSPKEATRKEVKWKKWYVVRVNKKIRYAYYKETVQLRKGRVHLNTQLWKQEEGYINEEHLGGYSADTDALSPLFYNYFSTYRGSKTVIDGSVKENRLKVRVNKGNTDLPVVQINLDPKKRPFFSSFFPVWLAKNIHKMKPGLPVTFWTILEDNLDLNFNVIAGQARLEQPDPYARKTNTQKLLVRYRELTAIWYVSGEGWAQRIIIPKQKIEILQVPEEKATSFFD